MKNHALWIQHQKNNIYNWKQESKAVKEEKDLVVIIQENVKIGKQVAAAALTANRMLDTILRSFVLLLSTNSHDPC